MANHKVKNYDVLIARVLTVIPAVIIGYFAALFASLTLYFVATLTGIELLDFEWPATLLIYSVFVLVALGTMARMMGNILNSTTLSVWMGFKSFIRSSTGFLADDYERRT